MRLYESLLYQNNAEARSEADAIVLNYLDGLSGKSAQQMIAEKRGILDLNRAFSYLVKHASMDSDNKLHSQVEAIALKYEWIKQGDE
jgi:hypothetical protein